jgi:hypothetical protein
MIDSHVDSCGFVIWDIIIVGRYQGKVWSVKVKFFAMPLALLLACQLTGKSMAETKSANVKKEQQEIPGPNPGIRFLRPLKDERFFDYPIFVQVDVTGFQLVPPGEHPSGPPHAHVGHILYSFDDYPVVATDDTQFMIGKKLGDEYLPVGLHVLKAQLVDVNDHPLNPSVEVATEVFSGHPAMVETVHRVDGSQKAELAGQELYKMRMNLKELENELKKLKTGDAGFTPTSISNPGRSSE